MIQRRLHILALALSALALLWLPACQPAPAGDVASQDVCEVHSECPPSHVCSDGACEPTCLTSALCKTSGALSGVIKIEATQALDFSAPTLEASASFVSNAILPASTFVPVAGTECVAVPQAQLQLPSGHSVGDLVLTGAAFGANGDQADGTPMATTIRPTDESDGTVYQALFPEDVYMQPATVISAMADDLSVQDDIEVQVSAPDPFEGLLVEPVGEDSPDEYTLYWTPGDAAQVIVQFSGAMPLNDGPAAPTTMVCPARDEAGVFRLPVRALQLFESGTINVRLTRRNIQLHTLTEGTMSTIAAYSYQWEELVPRR